MKRQRLHNSNSIRLRSRPNIFNFSHFRLRNNRSIYPKCKTEGRNGNGKREEISVSRYLVSLELDFSAREAATFAKAAEPRQRTILAAELWRKQPTAGGLESLCPILSTVSLPLSISHRFYSYRWYTRLLALLLTPFSLLPLALFILFRFSFLVFRCTSCIVDPLSRLIPFHIWHKTCGSKKSNWRKFWK